MELMKRFEPLALLLMVAGAIDWGVVGLFHDNLIGDLVGGGTTADVVYAVIGFCGVVWLPRLAELMHVDLHLPRPHGA